MGHTGRIEEPKTTTEMRKQRKPTTARTEQANKQTTTTTANSALPKYPDILAAAGGSGIEDPGLHLGRQGAVDGQDDQLGHVRAERFHPLIKDLARRVDLFLT